MQKWTFEISLTNTTWSNAITVVLDQDGADKHEAKALAFEQVDRLYPGYTNRCISSSHQVIGKRWYEQTGWEGIQ